MTLELHTGNPQQPATAILAGELDAGLVAAPIADGPFDKRPAFDEELAIVTAADHPPITPDGTMPRTIVAFEPECPHRKRLEDWYASHGAMPERTIEMSSYHAILGCVNAGMGVALPPRSVLGAFPESRRLSLHALPPGQDRAQTVLIWRKGAASPKIDAPIAALKDVREADSAPPAPRSRRSRAVVAR